MLSKLIRQLKREMAANKGRAAFLLSATVVAIYYWGTAIGGMLPTSKTTAPATPVALSAEALVVQPTANTSPQPASDWQAVRQAIDSDPLMKSADSPGLARDPFHALAGQASEDPNDDEDEPQQDTLEEVTPQTLGMALKSSLVGTRMTVINISGHTFSFPSDGVYKTRTRELTFENDQGSHRFRVVSARPGRVVLERNEKQFELTMGSPSLAGNEKIQFLDGSN